VEVLAHQVLLRRGGRREIAEVMSGLMWLRKVLVAALNF
jgi:hypothetical protein